MSGSPSGWVAPKTNWQATDVVLPVDTNRMEGNAQATEIGDRTVDPALAPSGNIGSLRQLLSWFANRIRTLAGTANWWDPPPTTLAAASTHHGASAPHTGHATTGALDAHAALTATHGVTGAIVGTRDAQTLTDKTLGTNTLLGAVLNAQGNRIDNPGRIHCNQHASGRLVLPVGTDRWAT